MPETGFTRPTLAEIISTTKADLSARHNNDPLRRSDDAVDASVYGGGLDGVYAYISHLAEQILPDTASAEYLERHASNEGITRLVAVRSAGAALFVAEPGAVIPAGVTIQGEGFDYITTAEAAESGGSISAPIQAVTAGVASELPAGAVVTIVSPIAGVTSAGSILSLSGGADEETDSSLLARLLAKIQKPPHGGARHDYVAWAKEIEGVTRVWVYPSHAGPGSVGVAFVRDGDADFIPDAAELAAVKDHIETVRPVTAEVYVMAPTTKAINPEIAISPDTQATRDAITAELNDFVRREAEPGSTIRLSRLREAISIAAGETFHDLVSPVADVTHDALEMAVVGTPVFSEAT